MALTYDFDIHRLIPTEVTQDPKIAGFLDEIGFNGEARGNHVALFRNPATAEALLGADEEVQAFFKASGFGFVTYDSGAGPGRFPAEDEAAVNDVAQRLAANVQKFDLRGKDFNGFDMGAFCVHLGEMKPVKRTAPAPMAATDMPKSNAEAGSPLERIQQKHAAEQAARREAELADLPDPVRMAQGLDPDVGMPKPAEDAKAGRVKGAPRSGRVVMALAFGLLAVIGMGVGLEMTKPAETETAMQTADEGGAVAQIMELIESFTRSAQ